MTPVEPELLNRLAYWATQAQLSNKWLANYIWQLEKTQGLEPSKRVLITNKRNDRKKELHDALKKVTEILQVIQHQYNQNIE